MELRQDYSSAPDRRLQEHDPAAITDAVADLVASSFAVASTAGSTDGTSSPPTSSELLVCWGREFLKGVSVFVVGGLGEALSNARAAILSDQVAKAGGLNCTAECPRR